MVPNETIRTSLTQRTLCARGLAVRGNFFGTAHCAMDELKLVTSWSPALKIGAPVTAIIKELRLQARARWGGGPLRKTKECWRK